MQHRTFLMVTRPGDPVRATLKPGPEGRHIPIIELGDPHGPRFEIHVHSSLLTPAEQEAWLRRLAATIDALADQVAIASAVPA